MYLVIGVYANPNVRKVSPEEIAGAKNVWRQFLTKILNLIKTDAEVYKVFIQGGISFILIYYILKLSNGSLDVKNNFGHALV